MFKKGLQPVLHVLRRSYANKTCTKTRIPHEYPFCVNVFPNGLRAVKEQTYSPIETIVLMIEAGPRFELPTNHGVTHFLEHMFDKGLRSKNHKAFVQYLTDIGARMWINTTRELQEITFTVAVQNVHKLLQLLPLLFTELDPPSEEISKAKEKIYNQLSDHSRDYRALCMDYAHEAAYQGTFLGKSVIGPMERVSVFHKDFLLCYICHHYAPIRMVISSTGRIAPHVFMNLVGCTLGCLPSRPVARTYGARFTGSMITYRNDDIPYTHCVVALEATGYFHKDYMNFRLLKHVMIAKGYNPSVPAKHRLRPYMLEVTERFYTCVTYEPFYCYYRDTGLWGLYVVAKSTCIDSLVLFLLNECMHVTTSLTESEFNCAKNSLRLEVGREMDSNLQSARISALDMMYCCGRRTREEWATIIDGVKVAPFREFVRNFFDDKEVVVTGVGKTEGLMDLGRYRSRTYWLRI